MIKLDLWQLVQTERLTTCLRWSCDKIRLFKTLLLAFCQHSGWKLPKMSHSFIYSNNIWIFVPKLQKICSGKFLAKMKWDISWSFQPLCNKFIFRHSATNLIHDCIFKDHITNRIEFWCPLLWLDHRTLFLCTIKKLKNCIRHSSQPWKRFGSLACKQSSKLEFQIDKKMTFLLKDSKVFGQNLDFRRIFISNCV